MNTMKWFLPPRSHTVPHGHHACLEGAALQIRGNQINEIQCVRRCTCACYAVHVMSCSDISTHKCNAYMYCTVDVNWSYRCAHEVGVFVVSTIVCKCICAHSEMVFVRYVCTISAVLLVYSTDCTSVCMHVCLWAVFQKCMQCKLPIAQPVLAPMELK